MGVVGVAGWGGDGWGWVERGGWVGFCPTVFFPWQDSVWRPFRRTGERSFRDRTMGRGGGGGRRRGVSGGRFVRRFDWTFVGHCVQLKACGGRGPLAASPGGRRAPCLAREGEGPRDSPWAGPGGRGMGVCFDSKGLVMGSKSAHFKKFPHSREAA